MSMSTLLSDTFFCVKVLYFFSCVVLQILNIFSISGVLGIKVKIMLPWDPNNKNGPKRPLPDNVSILEPKEDVSYTEYVKAPKPLDVAAPLAAQVAA